MTPPSSPGSFAASAVIGGLVAVLAAGTIAGILLLASLLGGAPAGAAQTPKVYRVGDDVPAPFGFVAVEHAEVLKGLVPRELGGAAHGIGSFVGRDSALVQAAVTITNTSGDVLAYDPAQFKLAMRDRRGRVTRLSLAHATVRPGTLQPDAAIDARLSFVAPRNGSRLEVEFAAADGAGPTRIALEARAGRMTAKDRRALAEGHAEQSAGGDGGDPEQTSHDHTGPGRPGTGQDPAGDGHDHDHAKGH